MIAELIELAKEMREAHQRGEELGLTEDELAFYDALEVNDSAVKVLGDETLRTIARELVETVRRNVTIDWTRQGKRQGQAADDREAHPPQVRLPAGQAGEGHPDRAGAGRVAVQGLGGVTGTEKFLAPILRDVGWPQAHETRATLALIRAGPSCAIPGADPFGE